MSNLSKPDPYAEPQPTRLEKLWQALRTLLVLGLAATFFIVVGMHLHRILG